MTPISTLTHHPFKNLHAALFIYLFIAVNQILFIKLGLFTVLKQSQAVRLYVPT